MNYTENYDFYLVPLNRSMWYYANITIPNDLMPFYVWDYRLKEIDEYDVFIDYDCNLYIELYCEKKDLVLLKLKGYQYQNMKEYNNKNLFSFAKTVVDLIEIGEYGQHKGILTTNDLYDPGSDIPGPRYFVDFGDWPISTIVLYNRCLNILLHTDQFPKEEAAYYRKHLNKRKQNGHS